MATILDEVLQLEISDLKKLGYLRPGRVVSGTVSWGNGNSRIGVTTDTATDSPCIEFNYTVGGKALSYCLSLVQKPSNLGKGVIWYFRCRVSDKLCRKLYLIDGYFVHREAFGGCIYECQAHSRKYRAITKLVGPLFRADHVDKEVIQPYYKKYYRGKPTRRYRRVLKIQEKALRHDIDDIDQAFDRILKR